MFEMYYNILVKYIIVHLLSSVLVGVFYSVCDLSMLYYIMYH